jgi:hypothetical protein
MSTAREEILASLGVVLDKRSIRRWRWACTWRGIRMAGARKQIGEFGGCL